jgi:hypothetical protein
MARRLSVAVGLVLLASLIAPVFGALGGSTRSAAIAPCSSRVQSGVLPVWMRGGFEPNPRTTYVLGEHGAIGGVLWGVNALNSPPAQQRNNKVLWVARDVSKRVAALWIKMQKMDGTQLVGAPVRRIIKTGPGPSLVDAPSAGCWRLTLTWSGRSDTLDLAYVLPTD